MFPHPGFIDSVTALGNFEWRISIQGATEEAHVATTGRAESFKRIVHGLGELQRRGQLVTTNMCVNERSYRSLPHYPELLARYGVRQLHVDIVRPESTGERDEDVPARHHAALLRHGAVLRRDAGGLRALESRLRRQRRQPARTASCPSGRSRIHHGGQETVTKSSDGDGLEDEMNKYAWQASLRTHLPGCADCVFRSRCTGIFRVYLELHGGDEFQPVSREALAALDPAAAQLRPARRAAARAAARRAGRERHSRHRGACSTRSPRIGAAGSSSCFAHDGGAQVRLRFVAPGSGRCAGASALRAYDVDAEADLAVPADALAELLDWVRARLAAGARLVGRPALADDAVERAVRWPLLHARPPARDDPGRTRCSSRFAHPAGTSSELRWPTETTGEVVARGPDGARVDVRFTLGTRGNRSQVGVEFGLADGGDQGRIKPVVDDLVGLLRTLQAPPTSRPAVH